MFASFLLLGVPSALSTSVVPFDKFESFESPIAVGGRMYAIARPNFFDRKMEDHTHENSSVVCFSAEGKLLWETVLPKTPVKNAMSESRLTPDAKDGVIVNGYLGVQSVSSAGKIRWSLQERSSKLVVDNDGTIYSLANEELLKIDSTGHVRARINPPLAYDLTVRNGKVLVFNSKRGGSFSTWVSTYDKALKSVGKRSPEFPGVAFAIGRDVVYVQKYNPGLDLDEISCISLSDFKTKWSRPTGEEFGRNVTAWGKGDTLYYATWGGGPKSAVFRLRPESQAMEVVGRPGYVVGIAYTNDRVFTISNLGNRISAVFYEKPGSPTYAQYGAAGNLQYLTESGEPFNCLIGMGDKAFVFGFGLAYDPSTEGGSSVKTRLVSFSKPSNQ